MKRRSFVTATAGIAAACLLGAGGALAQSKDPIKVGFSMGLTGGLAANGKAALIAMQIWEEDVNKKGGLLGRPVKLVFYDDQSNPSTVPAIYNKLLDVDKVDVIVSSYGTNLIAPAMPIAIQRKMMFVALFGLDVNHKFKYGRYFQIMPAGADPAMDWTDGYFKVVMNMNPKPTSIAIVGADAEFPAVALAAVRAHAKKNNLKIVYDNKYPPATTDYTPIVRAIQASNPDVVYVASYPPDSAGMVRAANEVGLKVRVFGGAMVGTQFAALRESLSTQLNGLLNYEFWAPEPTVKFPFIEEFIAKYQKRAAEEKVDILGYYLPPYAYAMMQVVEQSISATKSLDQGKLAEYAHKAEFDTVVGKVKFAKNGEWEKGRLLITQYQGVDGSGIDQWRKPGKVKILWPPEYKTGDLTAPYEEARKK